MDWGPTQQVKYLQQDAWVFIHCISYPWLLENHSSRDLNEQSLVCIVAVLGMSNFGWDQSGGSDNLSQTWLILLTCAHVSVAK